MNASRRREIEKIFDYFDRDHSQTLDAEEMLEFFKSLGEDMDIDRCKSMCVTLDADDDGTVSKEEFLQWMHLSEQGKKNQESIRDVAETMFNLFKDEGADSVDPEMLKKKLASFGVGLSDEDFNTFIHDLDPDGDGTITAEEFEQMLEKNHFQA